VALLAARERPDHDVGPCLVVGCGRQGASGPARLCCPHLQQRQRLGLSVAQFVAHPQALALVANDPGEVASCPLQRRDHDGRYCEAPRCACGRCGARLPSPPHPLTDEGRWRRVEPPIGVGGQVSLGGLPTLVVVQVLIGLQQRCRLDAVRTKEADLRSVCDDLRGQQAASISDYRLEATRSVAFAGLVNTLTRHARRVLSNPALEATGDEWDLAVFGYCGTLSFTGLTQPWLREAAKRWAADALPK